MLQEIALIVICLFLLCLLVYTLLNNSKRWPKFLKKMRYRNDDVPENEPVFTDDQTHQLVNNGLQDQKEQNV